MWISHGVVADLTGAHPHDAVEVNRPDLAVTDLAGASVRADEIEDLVDIGGVHHDLDSDVRVQVQETSPFSSCNIRVAVGMKGAGPVPDIVPTPKPAEFGGTALAGTGSTSPIWKKPEGTASVAYPAN